MSSTATQSQGTAPTVSVRELAELARWALVAAGADAGAARVAARIVQAAEVEAGCGLSGLLVELDHYTFGATPVRTITGEPARVGASPTEFEAGVTVVNNDDRRGLLTVGVLAAALVAARGSAGPAVMVPHQVRHPIVDSVLAEAAASVPSFDGSLVADWSVEEATPEAAHGLVISSRPTAQSLGESSAHNDATSTDRWASALRHGVEVDANQLARVRQLAARYLVDDTAR